MNEYDLTGKFGWYLALGFLVLVPAIMKWCESRGYFFESEPSLTSEPLPAPSLSQIEIELNGIRGEIALITGNLSRQQISVDGMADVVERIDQRLKTVLTR